MPSAQEHFPAVWDVLRHQQCANLASFMASRPAYFHRRAADGLFYRLMHMQGVSAPVQQAPSAEAFFTSAPHNLHDLGVMA